MAMHQPGKATIGLTGEEEEFLRKSNHKPKKEAEVMIDVHGHTHKITHAKHGHHVEAHAPGATNFITASDRLNHRFETTNDRSYGDGGRRSRSNSPGRVPIHHRKGAGADSPARAGSRGGSRPGSPAEAKRGGHHTPSKQAEEMVAKMLEASIDRAHK